MNYFRCGGGGNSAVITIDGVEVEEDVKFKFYTSTEISIGSLPYSFYDGMAVVYKNELHILGGNSSNPHYKYDGTTWTSDTKPPYSFYNGVAVVYKNELHILGGNNQHYKYDGTTWTNVGTLPFNVDNYNYWTAVEYKDELHVIGYYNYGHFYYKYDGTTWTDCSDSMLKYGGDQRRSSVVYNDEIHYFAYNKHMKINGSTWTLLGDLPKTSEYFATLCDNEIYIVDSGGNVYKYDGVTWTQTSTATKVDRSSIVTYNDKIHILGGYSANKRHGLLCTDLYIKER